MQELKEQIHYQLFAGEFPGDEWTALLHADVDDGKQQNLQHHFFRLFECQDDNG